MQLVWRTNITTLHISWDAKHYYTQEPIKHLFNNQGGRSLYPNWLSQRFIHLYQGMVPCSCVEVTAGLGHVSRVVLVIIVLLLLVTCLGGYCLMSLVVFVLLPHPPDLPPTTRMFPAAMSFTFFFPGLLFFPRSLLPFKYMSSLLARL